MTCSQAFLARLNHVRCAFKVTEVKQTAPRYEYTLLEHQYNTSLSAHQRSVLLGRATQFILTCTRMHDRILQSGMDSREHSHHQNGPLVHCLIAVKACVVTPVKPSRSCRDRCHMRQPAPINECLKSLCIQSRLHRHQALNHCQQQRKVLIVQQVDCAKDEFLYGGLKFGGNNE